MRRKAGDVEAAVYEDVDDKYNKGRGPSWVVGLFFFTLGLLVATCGLIIMAPRIWGLDPRYISSSSATVTVEGVTSNP